METLVAHAADLIYCKQSFSSTTAVDEVIDYFNKNSRLFVAIMDEGTVRGLASRIKLLHISKEPEKTYQSKPIWLFMDDCPLILDLNTKLDEFYRRVISRPLESVYDDVVITSMGVFLGLVSVKQLMLLLLQDFESNLAASQKRRANLKKPIIATVLTNESPSNDEDFASVESFLRELENGNLEPETVAVPLPQAPAELIKLRGHLDAFNVIELIQLLIQGGKTGRLDLLEKKKEIPFYVVYLDKGHIVHAEGAGERGKLALWKALGVAEGKFIFHYNLRPALITIQDDPTYLLMEACRMQDEAAFSKTQ